jgi:hypothetical protein
MPQVSDRSIRTQKRQKYNGFCNLFKNFRLSFLVYHLTQWPRSIQRDVTQYVRAHRLTSRQLAKNAVGSKSATTSDRKLSVSKFLTFLNKNNLNASILIKRISLNSSFFRHFLFSSFLIFENTS